MPHFVAFLAQIKSFKSLTVVCLKEKNPYPCLLPDHMQEIFQLYNKVTQQASTNKIWRGFSAKIIDFSHRWIRF